MGSACLGVAVGRLGVDVPHGAGVLVGGGVTSGGTNTGVGEVQLPDNWAGICILSAITGGGYYTEKRECTGNHEQRGECIALNGTNSLRHSDRTTHGQSDPFGVVQGTQGYGTVIWSRL